MTATMGRTYAMKPCPGCGGDGQVPGRRVYPGTGAYRPPERCRACDGSGHVRKYPPKGARAGRKDG